MKFFKIFSAGLAMFAMLFGAGNIVFPLALGRDTGDMVWYALFGFIITATIVPLIGLVSANLADGDYKKLFKLIGRVPGSIAIFLCLLLIGPFAIIPRCVTVSHSAVSYYLPWLSLFSFSLIAAAAIFGFTFRQSAVIDIIGRFLGPLKLTLLLSIVIFGLYWSATPPSYEITPQDSFMRGLIDGYWTLDLLATIFFSSLIFSGLKRSLNLTSKKQQVIVGLQAGGIGAVLLALVYAGFCIVAAMYAPALQGITDRSKILTVLASIILGPQAGILANITVAVACLTTSVALTAVFTDYLQTEIFKNKVNYLTCLLVTISITTVMANLGFEKIMNLIAPIVIACYPALIMLAIVNIGHQIWGWRHVKLPVALTLVATLIVKYIW
ncbi:branched-chain amino acid transporter [Candidatus Dependentiae bacterium Noda2021]|nr:branched-chain amino acid transporter [Candidatus Dependentiae bacterium Noda2021]